MKIVCISDTHGLHRGIKSLPPGDILIHAGDISNKGAVTEVQDFLTWFNDLPYQYKIFCAGNHDFFFDTNWKATTQIGGRRHRHPIYTSSDIQKILSKYPQIIYLEDSGIEIEGLKFWGSPISPWFHDWAFNRVRGLDIQYHWDKIPTDTQILITHTPVAGILDRVMEGELVGCQNLRNTLLNLPDLKLHVCGHIHEAYGLVEKDGVTFMNASTCNIYYHPDNQPLVYEIYN